jgi:hypothetical protein
MEPDDFNIAMVLLAQLPWEDARALAVIQCLERGLQFRHSETCPQQSTKTDVAHEVVLLRREGVGGCSASSRSRCSSLSDSPSVLPK